MPLKFDLEGALAEPASGLKFDIESALSPSVGRTPPQDQPLESDLAGIVQPRQELRQKPIGERIAGMRPAPAEIRNSPSTIYKADNPVLNAALGVPRAFVHGAEQAIQAGAGFTGNEQARKASERRVQGLMLESDFPDLEQGAGSMLAIAPAALINPAFGAAVGGGLAAGPAIGEGMEAGLSTPEAIAYGVGQGGLEYLTERIPIGILFGKGGAHVAERLVKAFFPEATGEQIATLTQDALRQSVIEPNKPWSEYWAERGEAAKRTLIATAGGLGAAGAIQAGVQRLVPQTNQFADVLDEVVRGTTIKPAGLDIVQDLYDRGRTRFANVPVQPQPELNVPSSASTLAQQPIQAAPLTAQGQATMPDEYAGPQGYAQQEAAPEGMEAQVSDVDTTNVRPKKARTRDEFDAFIAARKKEKQAKLNAIGEFDAAVILKNKDGTLYKMILPDASEPGKWRTQSFDDRGFSGHMVFSSKQEALEDAVSGGYYVRDDEALDRLQDTAAFRRGNFASDLIRRINIGEIDYKEGDRRLAEYDLKNAEKLAEVQAPAEEGRPQEVAFDVSGRTDEQLAWLAEHGKPGWREAAIAEGERRGIAPSATTPTTAQTPQQPAPKAKKPRKTGPSNNLIRRIHQLGGINLRYLPDVAGERKVQRGMPVGLFRKNGMGLDDLSRMLADEGFPINVEDPTDIDGVRQLTELLQKTLSGGTVLNYSGQQAMLDAMAKAEAEIDMPEQAALDDPEAIAEREAIKQADIAIQGVTNDELDALLDAAFNDERTPNAILSDEEIDQLFASASDAPQTQPEGQDADSVAGSPEAESFALDAYTPEDLKQREVQPEPERPEAPSPADFVLSGSSRQADEAEARGQIALPGAYTVSEPTTDEYTHDLFGNPLPDKPRARGSRAQQQAAQTRNVDTASSVPPGQYGTTTKLITHATREIGATNVSTVDEAATALSYLGRGAVERFDALVTDKNGKPLALVGSFKGALTQTSVYPSTVIAEAFRIPGAANIWFAHNHPSGTPELSQADRWLTSQLENVFEGTGINTHGTFAITNDGRYTHTDGGRGTIKPAKSTMRLDAVEREFDKFDKLGAAFSDPAAAQTEMRVMGLKDPGLVLLDTQNAPIAFIPMGGMEAMPLKHNGRLDALYRAISYANAGAAVIYDPRGDFTEAQYRNIGAALGQVDVKLLDVFQKGVSMAEKGRPLVASTLLSRGPNAAGMSVESATSLLRKRFGKRIDKMLEAGTLKIVATPAELPAWGKGQRGIGGAWDGTTAWIVASQASPETLAATYLHEVGEHAGMQEMLGDKYQDIITRLDDLIWDGDATANRAASRVPKDTPAKDEQHERLAYFIEEAQRARDSQPQTLSTKARQLLQDIIAAIRAWAYRQFGGITLTEADILALARQSAKRVADQASEKLGAMREAEVQMSRTDTINVDGVDRPTTNSNGQRIAQTEEGLRNFWRWFGDSQVVDNEGRPLVVYHGTGADFSEFKELSFFSPRTDVADIYAMAPTRQIDGGGANTMPVYLAIGIPFVFDSAVASDSLSRTVLGKRGKLAKVLEELEKQGFDGIVLENFDDLGGPQLQYVAFSPTQIKSATGNRGTFDPASPDIRFSKEPQSTDAEEMAKKFGFAIKGMADARIQPSAERAYIENQEMFERMKRGVVSNADSKKAGEALAAEVGWSPDSVDAFMKEAAQKGTPPVDILAAMFAMSRMQSIKLLEAQNPTQFIEYTMDVLRTLMATRAYGSEMGRALQFIGAMERMGGYTAADVTSEGGSLPRGQIAPPTPSQIAEQKTKAKQTAQKAKDILAKDPKLSDLVSEEAMTKALGGDNGIRKIMAAMHKQGKDVDLGMLVSYLSGMVDSIAKEQSENRSTLNKLMAMHVELWRANILTGLFTHEVNVTSNAANMLIEFGLVNPIQEMLPGGIGLGGYLDALKAMGGYRKVLTDIWALMKYSAFEEAPASRLSHLLDQRDPELLALMRGTEGSKWADTHRKFIPGLAGKVVRGAGFVPLGIEDAIFKVIPFRYELARQQAAGEQRNVTAAIDAANKLTFQDGTGMLGMVVAKMHEKAPYSEFWITFVKTMTNLIKRSFDLTPGLSQAKNWDALIGKEGDKARREAIALSIVGVGIASMVMALMGDDDDEVQLSGFAPFDRLKKLLWLEEHDNIGLRIGDEVYPFYRMSPLAEPAGLTIGAYNSIKQGEAGPLFNAMYQSIVTKHFMAKIADLIDGIEEVARAEGNEKSEAGERLVRRQLGGIATGTMIPNFIAQLGDMTDAEKREVNTIMQDLQKKIPGLRESLPSKLKVTGEVLGEPRYMSPFPVQGKPVKKDEVTRWLLKLGRGIDPNPKSIKDLPHDVRQTLLRERWEFLGYAYEASKDLDAETQEKIIRKMLSAWTENAKAARVMHELETPAD